MIAAFSYAALRREEPLWLTVNDTDLSRRHGGNGLIRVRAKTIAGESWQPKTRVNRAVPISQALRQYLDRYTPAVSDHEWFFPSPKGTRWDCDNFSADLRDANLQLGLQWT